jgi:hypothetical protein
VRGLVWEKESERVKICQDIKVRVIIYYIPNAKRLRIKALFHEVDITIIFTMENRWSKALLRTLWRLRRILEVNLVVDIVASVGIGGDLGGVDWSSHLLRLWEDNVW